MIARIQTYLPSSCEKAWRMVLQRDAFIHVTRGMLGFQGAEEWPDLFHEGQVIETRLLFFNLIPGWKHRLRITRVDHGKMDLASQEQGGFVRNWEHRKWIEKKGPESSCLYTDEIVIEAGWLTLFVWMFAHVFYRYRQIRMRQLAKHL